MIKKCGFLLVVIMILFTISGCRLLSKFNNNIIEDGNSGNKDINQIEENLKEAEENNKGGPDEKVESKYEDSLREQISKMSLDEKIGQMLIVGIEGYSLNDNAESLIEEYKVGGIIVLGKNVNDSNQLLDLLNSIRKKNLNNKIPLFMSIDEEGGRVTRVPKEFNGIPTNKVIGQRNDRNFSYNIGRVIAEEIKAFGFNMNFAPVIDIDSNPNNPVIGDRSFSSNAEVVSSLGVQTMKGIQSQDVIPVIKHFPGHGDTFVDSHKGLPIVENDLNRLESLELVPFSEAIKNNADAVMIAHILLPEIDKENPSSMSKIIITDILRKKLKFNGVVITDDMTMGAIMQNYDIGEAGVTSINAGTDIVLVCHGYDNELKVINSIKSAILAGEISEKRIDESVYRILYLKQKYKLKDKIIDSVDINSINKKISELLSR